MRVRPAGGQQCSQASSAVVSETCHLSIQPAYQPSTRRTLASVVPDHQLAVALGFRWCAPIVESRVRNDPKLCSNHRVRQRRQETDLRPQVSSSRAVIPRSVRVRRARGRQQGHRWGRHHRLHLPFQEKLVRAFSPPALSRPSRVRRTRGAKQPRTVVPVDGAHQRRKLVQPTTGHASRCRKDQRGHARIRE